MHVRAQQWVLSHGKGPLGDLDARRLNRQLAPPLASHVEIALPKSPRQEFQALGVMDAKCGDDIRVQSSLLRFEAYIGAIKVEARKLFIEGEAGGASEHKDDLIEGGAGNGLRKGLAEHFLQAGAVDMTLGSRVAGDAEDAEHGPVRIGLGEMGDGGGQLAIPFGRQIEVLVSKDEDVSGALADTGVVSRAGGGEAAHHVEVTRMADTWRTGEACLEDSGIV